MKKLSLNLEQLAVETFATEEMRSPRGTVRGHATNETTCNQIICDCPSVDTCESDCACPTAYTACDCTGYSDCRYIHSCGWSICQYSCWGTCGETCFC